MEFVDELGDIMPIWLPLSPPVSDSDFELRMEDDCLDFMYEIDLMSESRLPRVTHELRRPLAEKPKPNHLTNEVLTKDKDSVYDAVAKCLSMPQDTPAAAASPAYTENSFSMDDTSQDAKIEPMSSSQNDHPQQPIAPVPHQPARSRKKRPDNRPVPNRTGTDSVKRATTPPAAWREEADYDGADWNIVEDYALLQAVQLELANKHLIEKSEFEGKLMNWELVSTAVNKRTRFYRSARQCSIRYQMFVRPKELGQLVASDPISKRTMKVDLSTIELSHLRRGRMTTESQYAHDYGVLTDKKHLSRFRTVKTTAAKRQVQFWRGPRVLETRNLTSLETGMPPRHEAKMAEFEVQPGINLDVEDVITMTDDAITQYELSKKRLIASRQPKPSPRQDIRYHSLVERPYTVPISTELPPAPARQGMVIAVPPLVPIPFPVQAPLPPIQHLQPQQYPQQQQQQQQHPHQQQYQQHQQQPGPSGLGGVGPGPSGGPGVPMGGLGGGLGGQNHQMHMGHHQSQNQGHQGPSHHQMQSQQQHQGSLPSIGATFQQQQHQQVHHQPQHSQQQHSMQQHPQQSQQSMPMRGSNQMLHGSQGEGSQGHHLMHSGPSSVSGPSQQQMQPTIQRRTASGSNVQYIQQQQGQGQSYMVMGTSQSQQGQSQGGDGSQGGNGGQGGSSMGQQQHAQPQQQRVQYVQQGGGRGSYPMVMQQRGGRVMRPTGNMHQSAGRMFIDQRHQYPNVVPVRVMPAGQQPQRMVAGQRRAPAPGTVAAMVLPHRGNGGVGQIRTMHLSRRGAYAGPAQVGTGGQQRINVMVQPQNMRSAAAGGGGQGQMGGGQAGGVPAIRRQLVGRQLQRGDNNPQVAQVVVAPPQGMQAPGGGPPVLHMQRTASLQMVQQHSQQQQQHSQQQQQQAPPPQSHQQAPPPHPQSQGSQQHPSGSGPSGSSGPSGPSGPSGGQSGEQGHQGPGQSKL